MQGYRCTSCGHVAWSFLPVPQALRQPPCPVCDAATERERRHPGRDRRRAGADGAATERRGAFAERRGGEPLAAPS